jgi:hypothetical protein
MEEVVVEDEENVAWRPEPLVIEETEEERAAAERLESMKRAAEEARENRRLKRRNLLEEEEANKLAAENDRAAIHAYARDFDAKKAVIYSEILNPPYL